MMKPWLDSICEQVENESFIGSDPVCFMHAFDEQRDREIAGFLAALMAWGRRDVVLRKTEELLDRMGGTPFDFVAACRPEGLAGLSGFRHRTFTHHDICGLIRSLQIIYRVHDTFESFWSACLDEAVGTGRPLLSLFRERFLAVSDQLPRKTARHISDPERGSTCKRLSMYLRWCLRGSSPVDPGIWSFMPRSHLMIPFDVHVGREGRRLGLLSRRSNDWCAVSELTETLRLLDAEDPARYDFALFGIGALGYVIPPEFRLNRI